MSQPPPLPGAPSEPPAAAEVSPPPPVRAEGLWEAHADERILDAGFGADGRVRMVDALGTFTLLSAQGRPVMQARRCQPLRAATITPAGGALLLTADDLLVALDETGAERFAQRAPGVTAIGANSRMVATAGDRLPVRTLSPNGRVRCESVVEHAVAHVAPCSPHGHVVAVSGTGQISVLFGAILLWRLHIRVDVRSLAACDTGLFVVGHRDGAQVFDVSGWSLGLYDVGCPIRSVALSRDGATLLLLDDSATLHLVERESGFSTWREQRPRRQSLVRLSADGASALAVSSAGAVEMLAFARGSDRAGRLEVISRGVPAGEATWRYPTACIEQVEPTCRFAIDPQGTLVALTRDEGASIEVRDAAGAPVARTPGAREVVGLAFSGDGSALLVHGRHGVTIVSRDGSQREELQGAFTHVLPGPGRAVIAASGSPSPRLVVHAGTSRWEATLRAPAVDVLASADLRLLAVLDESGLLRAWASGAASPWQRTHEARHGSVALGGPGLVVAEGAELVGLRDDGAEAWRVEAPARLELFALRGHVFGRAGDNQFVHVGPAGEVVPIDARPNLGRSRLMEAPGSRDGALLELNVNGRVLTAFGLDGRIAWRTEAPDTVAPRDVLGRGALLAFRAGTRLCLLAAAPPSAPDDAAGRAAFLEL